MSLLFVLCSKKNFGSGSGLSSWWSYLHWTFRYGIWTEIGSWKWRVPAYFKRGWNGWAEPDTWSFDGYLAQVIHNGIKHLKKYQHGHPGDLTEKQWNKILDEIIWTFETADKIVEGDVYGYQKTNKKLQGKPEFKDIHMMTKKEQNRFDKGFALFNKFFFSLWD